MAWTVFLDHRPQRTESDGIGPVYAVPPRASLANESGRLQDGQVLTDRGPGDVELRGYLSRGEFAIPYKSQNPHPMRRGNDPTGLHNLAPFPQIDADNPYHPGRREPGQMPTAVNDIGHRVGGLKCLSTGQDDRAVEP